MSLGGIYRPADSRIRRVAVTGMGSFTGPAIVRSLRATHPNLEIWGLDARLDTEALDLCNHALVVPMARAGLLEALLSLVEQERIELLIPALDSELEVLASRTGEFALRNCLLLAGGDPFIQLCRSKLACSRFLRSQGLPFAPTWRCTEVESPETLPFPLLVKPEFGSGGKGQVLLQDVRHWKSGQEGFDGMVAQPLLHAKGFPGAGRAWVQPEFVAQTLHDSVGGLAGTFLGTCRKRGGTTWTMTPFQDPAISAVVAAMAAALVPLGLSGPCNFQGIVTDEGPVFFEVNPRFGGATGLRTALGFQEVGASIGLLADGASIGEVAEMLSQQFDKVALRRSTEYLVPGSRFVAEG